VIKAPREGSSVGIYIIHDAADVPAKLAEAAKFGNELLVEQFIAGRELTVGIVGDQALPIIEIARRRTFTTSKTSILS